MAKYITLGEKAQFFHDPYSGVTLAKGEVKELTSNQLNSKRVKAALLQGHIGYAEKPTDETAAVKKEEVIDTEALLKKFEALKEANKKVVEDVTTYDIEKISRKFKLTELTVLAGINEIELEEGDTKETILEAILN